MSIKSCNIFKLINKASIIRLFFEPVFLPTEISASDTSAKLLDLCQIFMIWLVAKREMLCFYLQEHHKQFIIPGKLQSPTLRAGRSSLRRQVIAFSLDLLIPCSFPIGTLGNARMTATWRSAPLHINYSGFLMSSHSGLTAKYNAH